MISFNNLTIRVYCSVCVQPEDIVLLNSGHHRENRALGDEVEYTQRGHTFCDCGCEMDAELVVYEYPIDFVNYADISFGGCYTTSELSWEYNQVNIL